MSSDVNGGIFTKIFADNPIMAILRGYGPVRSLQLAQQAWDLGIGLVEIPIQTDDDVIALREVCAAAKQLGKIVGAGTVVSVEHIELAARAGADFTVSPGFDREIVHQSISMGLPTIPGVSTPTEIQLAMAAGLEWVKAFPATVLGTSWFAAMSGPFPDIKFLGTGGIDAANAGEYFAAGARAVAVGSTLENSEQLPLLAALIEEHRGR